MKKLIYSLNKILWKISHYQIKRNTCVNDHPDFTKILKSVSENIKNDNSLINKSQMDGLEREIIQTRDDEKQRKITTSFFINAGNVYCHNCEWMEDYNVCKLGFETHYDDFTVIDGHRYWFRPQACKDAE